jgi:hypothetical protein
MPRLFIILCLAFAGCESREIERIAIGRVVDVSIVPTSFNESLKTQVKTDKRFVVIYSTISVPFGVEAYLVRRSDGRTYFAWEGGEFQHLASR